MSGHHKRMGILLSGGLDSAALVAHYLRDGHQIFPVYVRAGFLWEDAELKIARTFLKRLATPELHPLQIATLNVETAYDRNWSRTGATPGARSDDTDVFLPARNLLLVTKALLALSRHEVWEVALATLRGNPFPDATPAFFRRLEKVLSDSFSATCRIHVPFRKMTKSDVIRKLRSFPLHLSLSCLRPVGIRHCGECNKCAERQRAFREAGVEDRTTYVSRKG